MNNLRSTTRGNFKWDKLVKQGIIFFINFNFPRGVHLKFQKQLKIFNDINSKISHFYDKNLDFRWKYKSFDIFKEI